MSKKRALAAEPERAGEREAEQQGLRRSQSRADVSNCLVVHGCVGKDRKHHSSSEAVKTRCSELVNTVVN